MTTAYVLAFALLASIATMAQSEKEGHLDLFPQGEWIQDSQGAAAERLILEANSQVHINQFFFNFEGYSLSDGSGVPAGLRGDQEAAYLQEVYGEYRINSFLLRAGMQPLRWSESWVVPSMDIWTARRWNEMFFLPASYQFIHPTGILLSYDNSDTRLDFFESLIPAQDRFPNSFLAPIQSKPRSEWGARIKQRLYGFDVALLGAEQTNQNIIGGNVNYALDFCVPKIEAGFNDQNFRFLMMGFDIFSGFWSILPQITIFDSPQLLYTYERIIYLPIRYMNDPYTLEFQIFANMETSDQFYSALYTYNFKTGIQITGYVQNYLGENGSLFGFYQNLVHGGFVAGLRLGTHIAAF